MASPFPGMDPYLERFWSDVHARLVTYACDQLQERLPPDLIARMQEWIYVETPEGPGRSMHPDVSVVERGRGQTGMATALNGIAVAEPEIVVVSSDEPITETYLEIVAARSGHRVIAGIEFLSPTNKTPGPGQDLQKEKELRQARVNLVEIDLVRSGRRILGGAMYPFPTRRKRLTSSVSAAPGRHISMKFTGSLCASGWELSASHCARATPTSPSICRPSSIKPIVTVATNRSSTTACRPSHL
jgi:Protein of unknown function (DUF4058)